MTVRESVGSVIALLNHLHRLLADGQVRDQAAAARGILGPAIRELERLADATRVYPVDGPTAQRLWAAFHEAYAGPSNPVVICGDPAARELDEVVTALRGLLAAWRADGEDAILWSVAMEAAEREAARVLTKHPQLGSKVPEVRSLGGGE